MILLTISGLMFSSYATASYTPPLTTENYRDFLPPDEIYKIIKSPFVDQNKDTTDEEDLFKKQLGAIAERQQLMETAKAQSNDLPKRISQTEIFFNALTTCDAGMFFEKNIYANITGPDLLAHNIVGIKGNMCAAKLMTPDGNIAECKFDIYALDDINDRYMIEGLLEYNSTDTSQKSIQADLYWSEIKFNHCIYSRYPNVKQE